jgi:hypothetical protein
VLLNAHTLNAYRVEARDLYQRVFDLHATNPRINSERKLKIMQELGPLADRTGWLIAKYDGTFDYGNVGKAFFLGPNAKTFGVDIVRREHLHAARTALAE